MFQQKLKLNLQFIATTQLQESHQQQLQIHKETIRSQIWAWMIKSKKNMVDNNESNNNNSNPLNLKKTLNFQEIQTI